MSRAIERRLIAAERRLNSRATAEEIIIIREIISPGGLPRSEDGPTFATAGEMRWERAPAETLAAFRDRAVAAATVSATPVVGAWLVDHAGWYRLAPSHRFSASGGDPGAPRH